MSFENVTGRPASAAKAADAAKSMAPQRNPCILMAVVYRSALDSPHENHSFHGCFRRICRAFRGPSCAIEGRRAPQRPSAAVQDDARLGTTPGGHRQMGGGDGD